MRNAEREQAHGPPPRTHQGSRKGRMKRALLIAATLALLVPGKAAATDLYQPMLEHGLAQGLAYWEVSSVPGCSSISLSSAPSEANSGEATMPTPGAAPVPCIWVVELTLRPCEFQEVVIHETGHLLGIGHIEDRLSIMNPEREEGREGMEMGILCELEYWTEEVNISHTWMHNLGKRHAPKARLRFHGEAMWASRHLTKVRRKVEAMRAADLALKP